MDTVPPPAEPKPKRAPPKRAPKKTIVPEIPPPLTYVRPWNDPFC